MLYLPIRIKLLQWHEQPNLVKEYFGSLKVGDSFSMIASIFLMSNQDHFTWYT